VYVELPSFERRKRRAVGADGAALRLESSGIPVAVVRRGDDLSAVLGPTLEGAAHG
jgi:hypothetical protein